MSHKTVNWELRSKAVSEMTILIVLCLLFAAIMAYLWILLKLLVSYLGKHLTFFSNPTETWPKLCSLFIFRWLHLYVSWRSNCMISNFFVVSWFVDQLTLKWVNAWSTTSLVTFVSAVGISFIFIVMCFLFKQPRIN